MNYRKDIYEKVKFMLKDNTHVNINCSKLGEAYGHKGEPFSICDLFGFIVYF